jgi:hypothetical protein
MNEMPVAGIDELTKGLDGKTQDALKQAAEFAGTDQEQREVLQACALCAELNHLATALGAAARVVSAGGARAI